jgi:hypothetical protein
MECRLLGPFEVIVDRHDPPETARAVVQTYVKNLRHALAKLGRAM